MFWPSLATPTSLRGPRRATRGVVVGRRARACRGLNVLAILRPLHRQLPEAKAMLRASLAVDPGCRELQANLPRMGRVGSGPLLASAAFL
jgi:hypothetical protein